MGKYHMRKQEREITDEFELRDIINKRKYAIIAMSKDNEPYIVTLSYGYDGINNNLYFHTGTKGLKLDFIQSNPNVCATIIDDMGYINGECGHEYKSIVMFGKMSIIEDMDEKKHGMEIVLNHLEQAPTIIKERVLKNDEAYTSIVVLKLEISEISGKKGR